MAVSAQDVKKLREVTGAGMLDCKKALEEANGDFEEAIATLRKKGIAVAAKREGKTASEGTIASYIHAGDQIGVLVEVNCETDFVTKNDSFLALAQAAVGLIAAQNPADVAALGALSYSQDGFGPTLEDVRKGLIGKIGENMSFRRFKRFASGAKLASYLHGTRIGVVVEFDGDEVAAKDVAMHVAAMKPVAVSDCPATTMQTAPS